MKWFLTLLAVVVLAFVFLLVLRRPAHKGGAPIDGAAMALAFPLRAGGWTRIERRAADYPRTTEDRARRLVRELSAPDENPAVFAPLPETFPLRSIYLDGARLYLDVSQSALVELGGGTEDERIVLESLRRTLAWNLPDLDQLQILVDGRPRRTLGVVGEDAGHVAVDFPIPLK